MKKLVAILVLSLVCTLCAVGLAACDSADGRNEQILSIYNTYAAYAEENGVTPLSYDEWLKSIKGKDGKDGANGVDGINGKDGVSIVKIEKTSTDGLVDTYTITYSDGNTFEFAVTNGEQGAKGDQGIQGEKGEKGEKGSDGEKGEKGITPQLRINDATSFWEVSYDNGTTWASLGVNATGDNGKSAYELYKEKYGYDKSEEEWIADLINGELTSAVYTVSFNLNGGVGIAENQQVKNLKKATEPKTPTRTGYTFAGWYSGSECWIFSSYLVTENTELTANWRPNEYSVLFDSNGGNIITTENTLFNCGYSFETPVKDGYVFLGWYFDDDRIENTGVWSIAQDVTLTAKWVIAISTISFTTNNGETLDNIIVNYGDNYVLPVIEKEDYVFDGWYNGEARWSNGKLLAGDTNLSAKWKGANAVYDYVEKDGEITITSFRGGVKEVVIPKTLGGLPVTDVAENVFTNNTEIESVSFDGSFENYSAKMFEGCTSIRKLIISGTYSNPLYYLFGDDVSAVPESLIELQFAKNSAYFDNAVVTSEMAKHIITLIIDYNGFNFKNCPYLQSVVLTDSVTQIGDYAFYRCAALKSVKMGNGVIDIGEFAFGECGINDIILGNSVVGIGRFAFSCKSITFGDSVQNIGINALMWIENVNYLGTIDSWCEKSFSYCHPLKPEQMQSNRLRNFYINGELVTEAHITTATRICEYSLYCSSLTSVTIGDSVKSISTNAFSEQVKINEGGIYYVDNWAVGVVNTSLKTANLKQDTRGIASGAFDDCLALISIDISDDNAIFSSRGGILYNKDKTAIIIVPRAINGEIVLSNTLTSIQKNAFYYCKVFTSIIIPNSVNYISTDAFIGCASFKTIYYIGTRNEWEHITYYSSVPATKYFYSETEPPLNYDGTAYNGNFWHYDADGITPVVWVKEN